MFVRCGSKISISSMITLDARIRGHMALSQLNPKKLISGKIWPSLIPRINYLGSSDLGCNISHYLTCQHPKKLFWKWRSLGLWHHSFLFQSPILSFVLLVPSQIFSCFSHPLPWAHPARPSPCALQFYTSEKGFLFYFQFSKHQTNWWGLQDYRTST